MLVPGCTSCDILAGIKSVPGGTIYENPWWVVESTTSPVYWRGFLVVKLKRHCEYLTDLEPEEAAALGTVIHGTCLAVSAVLAPAKLYVASFGDGGKHVHFWVLPRPEGMRPGLLWVLAHLDQRAFATRRLGLKRWVVPDDEVAALADEVRHKMARLLPA